MKIFLFILGFTLGSLFQATVARASEAALILNGYAAKDYCSCRFVVGHTHQHCKKQIGVGFPLPHGKIRVYEGEPEVDLEVNEKTHYVVVGKNKPWNVRTAFYTGTRLGCRLLPPGQNEIQK